LTDPYIQFGAIADNACNGPFPVFDDPDGPQCVSLRSKVALCQQLISACNEFKTSLACSTANSYFKEIFGAIIGTPSQFTHQM
jgi:cathepsin A (carboxypeptidase C)